MTHSIEHFREQLVDYLYGQLEGDELRAFEAFVAESEEARRELSTLSDTLYVARKGLTQLADEPAPTHVSAAVLAFAAQHVERPQAARKPAATPRAEGGPWAWLRAPWLVPTLGVAAAVSIVVLYKRVESPDMTRHREPAATSEPATPAAPPEAPGPMLGEAPVPAAGQSGSASDQAREAEDKLSGALAEETAPQKRAPAPVRRSGASVRATPPSDWDEYAAPPPSWDRERAREQKPGADRSDESGAGPEALGVGVTSEKGGGRARRSQPRSSQREGEARAEGTTRAVESSVQRAPAATAPTLRATAPRPQPAAKAEGSAAAAAPAAAPSDDEGASNASDRGASRAPDEQVKRAQALLEQRRWSEAAVAYRELLLRYPRDARVPDFRKRLTQASQALGATDGRFP